MPGERSKSKWLKSHKFEKLAKLRATVSLLGKIGKITALLKIKRMNQLDPSEGLKMLLREGERKAMKSSYSWGSGPLSLEEERGRKEKIVDTAAQAFYGNEKTADQRREEPCRTNRPGFEENKVIFQFTDGKVGTGLKDWGKKWSKFQGTTVRHAAGGWRS